MKPIFVPFSFCLTTMIGMLGMAHQAQAGSISLDATNSGNYNQNGTTFTQASTTSYLTGRVTNPQENRSYFVFTIPANMSQASRTILTATLTLANPGTGTNGTGKTLNITNVSSGNITNLINNGGGTNTGRQTIFNDLGATAGNIYGSTPVITGSPVSFNLTQAGILTDIRNRAGQQFAVGGALTGLNTTTTNQTIFVGSTATPTSNRQLTITFADAVLGTSDDQQFGNVLIGQSTNRTLMVTNTGETGSSLTGSIGPSSDGEILSTVSPGQPLNFSLGAGVSQSRTYRYTPTVRGLDSTTIGIISNAGNSNILFTGTAVAPLNAVTPITPDVGFVRIGTNATARVGLQNLGDGNLSGQGAISNLNGTSSLTGSSANFLPTAGSVGSLSLTDNVNRNLDFQYTPTTSGPETQVLTLNFSNGSDNGTNQTQTKTVNLAGYGVGPAFQSGPTPDSTLDFGKVYIHKTEMLDLVINNGTQDPTAVDNLTGLTLLNAFFEGPDAQFFSLANFVPGTVLSKGENLALKLLFNSNINGPKNAVLRILTDQGAAFGQAGQTFSYNLTATAIPEPSSLLGIGVFATTGMLLKRKRDPLNKG
ncbi:choice-of-anchor D domain-containing protein [Crocosphaera sp. XPORK-15E]|uniref:choice-of-anchor D domain-containing protein n=1 Tax=Crocosphaera sp. XPORK-15E TaxID=3110247 RepID=UPI002B1FE807|nr:choice-of-anchor D domain-containing protein [Crocosphaera sp. XPORK-15E]MEA5535301.1 choice-of-anchor D domain-containing protein [Crocosphaera sp. XPORK-15E]